MKFIHTADLHLDSALSSIGNRQKANQRRRELTDTFSRLASFAATNNIDGVIVAGDLFDVKNATPSVKRQVADIIKSAKNVIFFLLAGNHDSKAFDGDFEELLPKENVCILKNGKPMSYGGVVIVGFDDGYDLETIPTFAADKFNVVVMHGQTVSGSGDGINVKKLAGKNIDYLALGHLHAYSQGKIDKRGKYAYCGCLEGRGFDELGEKGFVIFDTDGNVTFKPFAKRQCREVKVDISGLDSYLTQFDKVQKELAKYSSEDIYKVILTGEMEEGQKAETLTIEEKLTENQLVFFAKVVDDTKLKLDFNKLQKELSLRGEFFRIVSELNVKEIISKLNINERDEENIKNAILKLGFNALDGLGVDDD